MVISSILYHRHVTLLTYSEQKANDLGALHGAMYQTNVIDGILCLFTTEARYPDNNSLPFMVSVYVQIWYRGIFHVFKNIGMYPGVLVGR